MKRGKSLSRRKILTLTRIHIPSFQVHSEWTIRFTCWLSKHWLILSLCLFYLISNPYNVIGIHQLEPCQKPTMDFLSRGVTFPLLSLGHFQVIPSYVCLHAPKSDKLKAIQKDILYSKCHWPSIKHSVIAMSSLYSLLLLGIL